MIRITDIQRFCMHDGPGVRTTVFFKGCPLRCAWCHNPETQRRDRELLFREDRCIGCTACAVCRREVHAFSPSRTVDRTRCVGCGACVDACPAEALEVVGTDLTAEQLFAEIEKDRAFYGADGGVTFSGGECLLQPDALADVMTRCRDRGIHTAVDTCGHVPFAHFEAILPLTDLFLFDVKCLDPEKHNRFVGADNALILDNLRQLLDRGATVWVRIPVVPSVNDSVEEMERIKAFLDRPHAPQRVELLPCHAMGSGKYRALGSTPPAFAAPDDRTMQALRAVFE